MGPRTTYEHLLSEIMGPLNRLTQAWCFKKFSNSEIKDWRAGFKSMITRDQDQILFNMVAKVNCSVTRGWLCVGRAVCRRDVV